jgi:conjugative relaxase-like TrwC/TraI family protein
MDQPSRSGLPFRAMASMLRFHQNTSAGEAKAYYSQADYYLDGQETVGQWGGRAAVLLGLRGTVDKQSFDRLCDNLHPLTGERLTARTKSDRTVGNDLTFDVPKSVSVLYEMTQDARIRDAFRESVQETMRELEAEAKTRVRRGGADGNRTTANLVWATFYHSTSRPEDGVPDMNLHAHCFTSNTTWDPEEKKWKAVQFQDLRRDAPYWEAAFQQRLATRLVDLGFAVKRKGRYFELEGVPQSVITKFSRRTARIEQEARDKGITDPKEKGELGAKTRQKKAKNLSMEELRREWVSRLTEGEFDALAQVVQQAREREAAGWKPDGVSARDALAHAADHCFERRSSVAAKELLSEAMRFSVGTFGVADAWRNVEKDGRFTAEVEGRLMAASRDVLAEERSLVKLAAEGRASVPALNPAHVIGDERLNEGQRKAVRHLLGSRDRVSMVIGDAGVGKTTALKEAVAGMMEEGSRVIALAPSAAASRLNLRAEGFPEAETVAKFLADAQLQGSARGQVILVDEAALLGTKDMAKLLGLAKELDARLWLIGDDKQHRSVARGSPFALLQEQAGICSARIAKIQRQGGRYREVVELARDKPREGFEKLAEVGWVREIPTAERYRLLAADYVDATRPAGPGAKEPSALVIAPTHAEGARVTAEIRNRLAGEGRLGEEREFLRLQPLHLTEAQRKDALSYEPGDLLQFHQNAPGHRRGERLVAGEGTGLPLAQAARFQVYRSGTLHAAVGDRIRVTQNGTSQDGHRLNNGDTFTVSGFTPTGDIVDHRSWVIGRDFGHLAHGYVTTSVSAQSRTVDRVLVAMGTESIPAVSREQLYVSLSRGRQWARVYTNDREALGKAVARSDPRLSASEVAARRKAKVFRRTTIRKHVRFLQRLIATERARSSPTVDRARERVAERHLDRGLAHHER